MFKKFHAGLLVLMIVLALGRAVWAQDAEEASLEAWPPHKDGGIFPLLWGPEAYGGGVGYIWNDLGGKDGRRVLLVPIFADTDYRTFWGEATEPDLIREGDRLDFTGFYQKRTGVHYFGIGREADLDDGAYYQRENYLYKLSYLLPVLGPVGMTGEIGYDRTVIRKSALSDRPDFQAAYPALDRPVEDVYGGLLQSREARDEFTHYWAVSLWLDTREGPVDFTTRGVYLRGTAARVDENNGAEWNYWHYIGEGSVFVPLGDEFTVAAARVRWDRMDGRNVPFYKLPSLGTGRFSMAHVMDARGMRGTWENEFCDRNRMLASAEVRRRIRGDWIPESWVETEFPFGFNISRFIRNTAVITWLDAGQVWSDDEKLDSMRLNGGVSAHLFFDNGTNQQISVGFSDELNFYLLFTYGAQF